MPRSKLTLFRLSLVPAFGAVKSLISQIAPPAFAQMFGVNSAKAAFGDVFAYRCKIALTFNPRPYPITPLAIYQEHAQPFPQPMPAHRADHSRQITTRRNWCVDAARARERQA